MALMGKRDWAELPKDTLEHIVHQLGAYAGYVRVRAVCRSWRYSLPNRPSDHHQLLPRQLPWLVLQSQDNLPITYGPRQLCHGFFSFSEKKVHRLLDSINDGSGLHLVGSSRGWLVMVDEMSLSVTLLNPITGHRIPLPPLTTLPCYISTVLRRSDPHTVFHQVSRGKPKIFKAREMSCFFLRKVMLTSNPTTTKFMVIAILRTGHLGLFNPENGGWTQIDLSPHPYRVRNVHDMVYFNEKINLLDRCRCVYAYNMSSNTVRTVVGRRQGMRSKADYNKNYLVDMCGELLVVVRSIKRFGGMNCEKAGLYSLGFEVFKVVDDDERKGSEKRKRKGQDMGHLVNVKSLGDRALFLGGKTGGGTSSFSADEECGGLIKRNCIYFTNHFNSIGSHWTSMAQDCGVFNLEDGSIQPIPFLQSPVGIWPSPLWSTPQGIWPIPFGLYLIHKFVVITGVLEISTPLPAEEEMQDLSVSQAIGILHPLK